MEDAGETVVESLRERRMHTKNILRKGITRIPQKLDIPSSVKRIWVKIWEVRKMADPKKLSVEIQAATSISEVSFLSVRPEDTGGIGRKCHPEIMCMGFPAPAN